MGPVPRTGDDWEVTYSHALEIAVGPLRLAIHQGHGVLITNQDGQIPWPSDKGLYFFDTRLISSWRIYANGEPWDLLNAGAITHYASRIFLTNRTIATENGPVAPRTLALVLSRSISGGVHEDLDLVNHGMQPVRFNLEIAIRSDGAYRAPRPDRYRMVGRSVTVEDCLSQPGFLPRSNHPDAAERIKTCLCQWPHQL